MDGLLVIDKPAGPTSHDVVARIRRVLDEPRIGHTGTLDPAATGVLALVLGRATRLAQFLSNDEKSYEAVVRFGFATDTADAQGRPVSDVVNTLPSRAAIEAALAEFRGTFMQQPPAFSAKKIGGKRSHRLARARARDAADARLAPSSSGSEPVLPAAATVTTYRLEIVSSEADCVTLRVDCSAGFYVRALAHDLGERLGIGGHLVSLRRTRAGDFTLDRALPLETAERDHAQAAAAVVPLADMLPQLPAFTLTADGVRRAKNGCELGPRDSMTAQAPVAGPESARARLIDPGGGLVGVGRVIAARGVLRPCVILV
jgi:tRNA pseudouridine55 synthase